MQIWYWELVALEFFSGTGLSCYGKAGGRKETRKKSYGGEVVKSQPKEICNGKP